MAARLEVLESDKALVTTASSSIPTNAQLTAFLEGEPFQDWDGTFTRRGFTEGFPPRPCYFYYNTTRLAMYVPPECFNKPAAVDFCTSNLPTLQTEDLPAVPDDDIEACTAAIYSDYSDYSSTIIYLRTGTAVNLETVLPFITPRRDWVEKSLDEIESRIIQEHERMNNIVVPEIESLKQECPMFGGEYADEGFTQPL